jgi:DNA-binding winged helix-turn-helix (wHTH) protein
VISAIFLVASSFTGYPGRDVRAKQVNLIIRQIGHRLLLDAGDYTTRVLPVTEISEGTFRLEFGNEFVFSHASLMDLSQSLLSQAQFLSSYTVTVHDCLTDGIVYGFQVNTTAPDIMPCRGRPQPRGCYTIEFAFHGFYAQTEEEKVDETDADQQPAKERRSAKADVPKADPKPEALIPETSAHNLGKAEESKPVSADLPEATPKLEESTTTSDFPLTYWIYGSILAAVGVSLLIGRFRKTVTLVPAPDQDHVALKESAPELAVLGKFLFDVKGQRLLLEHEVISLTDKECRILELLHQSFGELIARETLMEKIWINEGVITTRSLDVFVSKLRKKLSPDPGLRITNVHGKGYKLEVSEAQTSPAS